MQIVTTDTSKPQTSTVIIKEPEPVPIVINEDDIAVVMTQTEVDRETAIEALQTNKNNIVDAILALTN